MATVATIPITIQPEAAAFLDQAGQRRELEIMLEQAQRMIPNLRSLNARFYDFPETGSLQVVIDAERDCTGDREGEDPGRAFDLWQIKTFPPEVCVNITLDVIDYP